ncbi:hypothetical protein OIO90_001148 [Microbotryomycetes sp. JL221]|nr:hypothetical protein OIO90_001148 [Microbotryomycetes sp. JL221]
MFRQELSRPPFHLVNGGKPARKPLDSLCIPTTPPYSLSSFIPPPMTLSVDQLRKLYKLSALEPPKDLNENHPDVQELKKLAAIVEGIRLADKETGQHQTRDTIVDARVRAPSKPIELERDRTKSTTLVTKTRDQANNEDELDVDNLGRHVLDLATKRDGAYFVVPTPENIRGKKRSNQTREE